MADLRFFASARAAVGAERVPVRSIGLPDIVDSTALRTALIESWPAASDLLSTCTFLVDGQRIGDREVTVGDHDTIDVLPPFAGG